MEIEKRIEKAKEVAESYMFENAGEIPVLVIAHSQVSPEETIVGKFRKDERGGGEKTRQDQKQFCSVMQVYFASKNITSYEVVCKPVVNNTALNLTQNLLAIFHVNKDGNSYGEFFEIENDGTLTSCYTDMTIESWFSKLIPNKTIEIEPKALKNIEKYVSNCVYIPAVPVSTAPSLSIDEMLDDI
jgi:hypothetical protein